jgi:predicted nucleic acid-binding protein
VVSFLLDTNVLSELRKGPRADPNVLRWLAAVPDDELFTSVLVVGEVRRGGELIRRRDPSSFADEIQARLPRSMPGSSSSRRISLIGFSLWICE